MLLHTWNPVISLNKNLAQHLSHIELTQKFSTEAQKNLYEFYPILSPTQNQISYKYITGSAISRFVFKMWNSRVKNIHFFLLKNILLFYLTGCICYTRMYDTFSHPPVHLVCTILLCIPVQCPISVVLSIQSLSVVDVQPYPGNLTILSWWTLLETWSWAGICTQPLGDHRHSAGSYNLQTLSPRK